MSKNRPRDAKKHCTPDDVSDLFDKNMAEASGRSPKKGGLRSPPLFRFHVLSKYCLKVVLGTICQILSSILRLSRMFSFTICRGSFQKLDFGYVCNCLNFVGALRNPSTSIVFLTHVRNPSRTCAGVGPLQSAGESQVVVSKCSG